MIEESLDKAAGFALRHRTAISAIGFLWFWGGVAITARFVELPDLPEGWRDAIFWSGVAVNATWWGFVQPRLARRMTPLPNDRAVKLRGKIRPVAR